MSWPFIFQQEVQKVQLLTDDVHCMTADRNQLQEVHGHLSDSARWPNMTSCKLIDVNMIKSGVWMKVDILRFFIGVIGNPPPYGLEFSWFEKKKIGTR